MDAALARLGRPANARRKLSGEIHQRQRLVGPECRTDGGLSSMPKGASTTGSWEQEAGFSGRGILEQTRQAMTPCVLRPRVSLQLEGAPESRHGTERRSLQVAVSRRHRTRPAFVWRNGPCGTVVARTSQSRGNASRSINQSRGCGDRRAGQQSARRLHNGEQDLSQ